METELYQSAPEPSEEVTVNFKMEKGLNNKLKALAKKRGISFAGLMRTLGIAELEREEKK